VEDMLDNPNFRILKALAVKDHTKPSIEAKE
jgi:hypothetical protein